MRKEFENTNFEKMASHSTTNPKKWWSFLKKSVGYSNKEEIPPLNCNGEIIYDCENKCNKFNDYFTSICTMNDDLEHDLDLGEIISHPDYDINNIQIS